MYRSHLRGCRRCAKAVPGPKNIEHIHTRGCLLSTLLGALRDPRGDDTISPAPGDRSERGKVPAMSNTFQYFHLIPDDVSQVSNIFKRVHMISSNSKQLLKLSCKFRPMSSFFLLRRGGLTTSTTETRAGVQTPFRHALGKEIRRSGRTAPPPTPTYRLDLRRYRVFAKAVPGPKNNEHIRTQGGLLLGGPSPNAVARSVNVARSCTQLHAARVARSATRCHFIIYAAHTYHETWTY